jgi:hypothetical protein
MQNWRRERKILVYYRIYGDVGKRVGQVPTPAGQFFHVSGTIEIGNATPEMPVLAEGL